MKKVFCVNSLLLCCNSAMNALGDCFKRLGKLSDAERLLQGSLAIMKVALPGDHLEVASSR